MRRITVVLDVALETESNLSVREIAEAAEEEIEMLLPSVAAGRAPFTRPTIENSARVTRVAVSRASEQS